MATKGTTPASVEIPESTALVQFDYAPDDVGGGYGNQDLEHVKIPFVEIIQKGTPAEKIGGQDPLKMLGRLFNTISGEIYPSEGILFVPVAATHRYLEFVPRSLGGGFRGEHAVLSDVVKSAKAANPGSLKLKVQRSSETGTVIHELNETFSLYGVICSETEPLMNAVLAFGSTKIVIYKKWMTLARMLLVQTSRGRINPPLYGNLVRVSTEHVKKDQYEWETFVLTPGKGKNLAEALLTPNDPRFLRGKELSKIVLEGSAQGDYSGLHADEVSQATTELPF